MEQTMDDGFDWTGFERLEFYHLKLPLLLVVGPGGALACGYFKGEIFDVPRARQAAVVVTGVATFEDMLRAKPLFISEEAEQRGITLDDNGRAVLENFRHP